MSMTLIVVDAAMECGRSVAVQDKDVLGASSLVRREKHASQGTDEGRRGRPLRLLLSYIYSTKVHRKRFSLPLRTRQYSWPLDTEILIARHSAARASANNDRSRLKVKDIQMMPSIISRTLEDCPNPNMSELKVFEHRTQATSKVAAHDALRSILFATTAPWRRYPATDPAM